MKKVLFLIVSIVILGLVFAGCDEIMKVSAPILDTERSVEVPEILCDYAYATDVIDYHQGKELDGVSSIDPDRTILSNATGEVNGDFFSLGFFPPVGDATSQPERGRIVLDFGQMVGGCINVLETSPINGTYHEGNYYLEKAEVYVNDDLSDDWVYLGIAQNQRADAIPVITPLGISTGAHPNVFQLDEDCIRYVKIVDITDPEDYPSTQQHTHDAFDVDAVYAGECTTVEVPLDIKPTSCPNPLNTKSNGVTPVAILGTADFDVTLIDPDSVLLEGITPLRWDWEDVAAPFEPYTGKEDCDLDCNTLGPDGYEDLTLKFDAQELFGVVGTTTVEITDTEVTTSILEDGACLVLKLTGELYDGTPIYGEDVVRILKKGK